MKIKICGFTRAEDVEHACREGVDMVGFVFAESPRQVSIEQAKELSAVVPPGVAKVGVFVNEDTCRIQEAVDTCGLDYIQMHGDESPAFCSFFGSRSVKAFRIKEAEDLQAIPEYNCEYFLLDTFVRGVHGGTGRRFDPALAKQAKTYGTIMIAGGLNPHNIKEIITEVSPWGVDVSSGVEQKPGIKDHELISIFIHKARNTM